MKKYIRLTFLLTILLLCSLFLTSCSSKYSKEKTLKLLQKTNTQNNYSVEIDDNLESLIMKQKDNIYVITSLKENADTFKVYENYDTDEIIIMDEKYALCSKMSEYFEKEKDTEYLKPYMDNILKQFKSDNYEYSFIEKTDNNSIIVNLKQDNENFENINYTIDLKTGFVIKTEKFNTNGDSTEIIEYKINLDNVSKEDIKKPDLTNLKTINI